MRQRYCNMEGQKPWPGLACNQNVAEGGGLEVNVEKKKCQIGRHCEQTSVTQAYHRRGLGAKQKTFFSNFLKK